MLADTDNLGDLGDIIQMARSIQTMSESVTMLTDFAKRKAEELLEYVPKKEVITPLAIVGGILLGGYLITGIIANAKDISKK